MRVTILGVGNDMKADDGIGIFLARELRKSMGERLDLLIIETQVPENFIKPVLKFRPGKIIMLDSADFGGKPGDFRLIKENEIMGFLVSTHNMPLTVFLKALEKIKAEKILVGIQPKSLEFGKGLSRELKEKSGKILGFVRGLL